MNNLGADSVDAAIVDLLPNCSQIHLPLLVLVLPAEILNPVAHFFLPEEQLFGLFFEEQTEFPFDSALEQTEEVTEAAFFSCDYGGGPFIEVFDKKGVLPVVLHRPLENLSHFLLLLEQRALIPSLINNAVSRRTVRDGGAIG